MTVSLKNASRSVGLLSIVLSGVVNAGGSLDLGINNTSAALDVDATRVGSVLHVSAGGMYNVHAPDLLSAGLQVIDQRLQVDGLFIGVGLKSFAYFSEAIDSGAVGLGGFTRYNPGYLQGLGLYGHAYYAPEVLSVGDTKALYDTAIRVEYSLIPNAKVFFGYRYVAAQLEKKPKYDVETLELVGAFHLGMRIAF